MTEFNQLFDGGLAERVFFIFSIVFMLAYACGFLFMRRTAAGSSRSGLRSRTAMMAFFSSWRFPPLSADLCCSARRPAAR